MLEVEGVHLFGLMESPPLDLWAPSTCDSIYLVGTLVMYHTILYRPIPLNPMSYLNDVKA